MRTEMQLAGAGTLSILSLVVYGLTLAPSVPAGDSGEFIAVAFTGGVAHPPGYPFYTMLAWVATALPLGEVAVRINAISAVCDALAAGVLFLAVARWTRSSGAALLAGGLFAFAPLIWAYAVVAEVFALNNLWISCLFYVLVRFEEQPGLRWAGWGALVVGLGLSNHHTFVAYAAPVAAFVAWKGRDVLFRPRSLAVLLGLFVLGLLPYAYLPLAGSIQNPLTWGDFSSASGVLAHILRSEYGTFQLGAGEGGIRAPGWRLGLIAAALVQNTLYVGFPVALVSWFYACWGRGEDRAIARVMLAGLVLYLALMGFLFNLAIDNPVLLGVEARFWQMAAIPIFVWVGIGTRRLIGAVARQGRAESWTRGVAAAAVLLQCLLHFGAMDQSRNFVLHDFARTLVRGLPEGAVLLLNSDSSVNAVRYLQAVEGARPDLEVIPLPWLSLSWYPRDSSAGEGLLGNPAGEGGDALRALLASKLGAQRVFVYPGFGRVAGEGVRDHYRTLPLGLAREVLPAEAADGMDVERRRAIALENLEGFDPEVAERYGPESWEHFVAQKYRNTRRRIEAMGSGRGNSGERYHSR